MVTKEKDIKFYTGQNREVWNEVMPRHQAAAKERWDKLIVKK